MADFKDKYVKLLNEVDAQEGEWKDRMQLLYSQLLRFIGNFKGRESALDEAIRGLPKYVEGENLPTEKFRKINDLVNESFGLKKTDSAAEIDELKIFITSMQLNEELQTEMGKLFIHLGNATSLDARTAILKDFAGRLSTIISETTQTQIVPTSAAAPVAPARVSTPTTPIPSPTAAPAAVPASSDPFVSTREAIIHLLEQLPKAVNERLEIDHLKNALTSVQSVEGILVIVDTVRDGVTQTLEDREQQIIELSGFLEVVVKRLDSLKLHLLEEESSRVASGQDRGVMSKLVGNHLQHIRTSVAEADDLNTLQSSIESKLDEIDGSVSMFVQSESDRAEKAEQATQQLSKQLETMEVEATNLRDSLEEARIEAMVDPLTGIANRRAYTERLDTEYARWKRKHEPLTMAVMDIDKFKRINDDFGHPVGDKVLQAVAGRIQQQVRESDFFGRIGGEEFALLLVGSNVEQSRERIETVRKSIEDCNFKFQNQRVPVTMSIGYAEFRDKDSTDAVYQRADEALLKCKQTGRNKILSEND